MSADQIREVEYGVLDQEYKRFDLLRLPEDLAITRLLKVKGDFDRSYASPTLSDISPHSLHSFASLLGKGLSHCLRWVCRDCPVGSIVRGGDWMREDQHAVDFLEWGMRYALLATDHVAWSNSLIDATIDQEQRTIVFGPPKDFDGNYYSRQLEADLNWWKSELVDGFPERAFVKLFNDWQRQTDWEQHGLHFPPTFVLRHDKFSEMRDWMTHLLFSELAEDCDLGAYRVGHLRTFFSCLQTICDCIRTLEDEVDRRVGQENRMGTWTFQLPRHSFLDWLAEATDLSRELVDSIVADLTLDPQRFHCAITTTPFVLSRRGTLFLLPRMFADLSPQRSFAAALTKGSGRSAYERIANSLEKHHLDKISTLLKWRCLSVTRERMFATPDGTKFKPDLVVADSVTADIVVVDFKNSLAATAVVEVTNRLKEYKKGISQIERYVARFKQFPSLLRDCGGKSGSIPNVRGLLLCNRSPLGNQSWASLTASTAIDRVAEKLQCVEAV